MRILINDKKHLPAAAGTIISHASGKRHFAFYGAMGSGKTTIIKAICMELGAEDIVSSPTFNMINEYRTTGGETIYHIDFYRIRKPEEALDFGIEEYFASGSYCLMEWPELIEYLLPPLVLNVRITVGDKEQRIVDIS